MDRVTDLIEPIKGYIKKNNELEYIEPQLPTHSHQFGTLIINSFNVDTTNNGVVYSQSSHTNKKLLKSKLPFKDNTDRRYNPKFVQITYSISEKYIKLIVNKMTGVREKTVDITGFSINSDNKYFKSFLKTINKKSDISKIDMKEFDIFCEMRFSKRKGLYVFNDYLENPDGVVYYENGVESHTDGTQPIIGYDEAEKQPHGEKNSELKMSKNEEKNVNIYNNKELNDYFVDVINTMVYKTYNKEYAYKSPDRVKHFNNKLMELNTNGFNIEFEKKIKTYTTNKNCDIFITDDNNNKTYISNIFPMRSVNKNIPNALEHVFSDSSAVLFENELNINNGCSFILLPTTAPNGELIDNVHKCYENNHMCNYNNGYTKNVSFTINDENRQKLIDKIKNNNTQPSDINLLTERTHKVYIIFYDVTKKYYDAVRNDTTKPNIKYVDSILNIDTLQQFVTDSLGKSST